MTSENSFGDKPKTGDRVFSLHNVITENGLNTKNPNQIYSQISCLTMTVLFDWHTHAQTKPKNLTQTNFYYNLNCLELDWYNKRSGRLAPCCFVLYSVVIRLIYGIDSILPRHSAIIIVSNYYVTLKLLTSFILSCKSTFGYGNRVVPSSASTTLSLKENFLFTSCQPHIQSKWCKKTILMQS